MGSIVVKKTEFIDQIGKAINYKSGLNLSIENFQELLIDKPEYSAIFQKPFDVVVRIDSVSYEELFAYILEKVGVAGDSEKFLLVTPYSLPYVKTPIEMKAIQIANLFILHIQEAIRKVVEEGAPKEISFKQFIEKVFHKFGIIGKAIAQDMVKRYYKSSLRNPYSVIREVEWLDVKELDELFKSENLTSQHGDYFDQRYINFLNSNFEKIGEINWRQFEGLAAEYLTRAGFYIELGPGRNDGGVDIRAWTNKRIKNLPPAMLVQVKRYKEDVDQMVVKSLWADMIHEDVESGLIVTTSRLAPSAVTVNTARSYNVSQANRQVVEEWIKQMRIPESRIDFLDKS